MDGLKVFVLFFTNINRLKYGTERRRSLNATPHDQAKRTSGKESRKTTVIMSFEGKPKNLINLYALEMIVYTSTIHSELW
jgi:hypothetical protein